MAKLAVSLIFFLCLASAQARSWVIDGDTRVASHALRVGVITFELPEGRSTGTAFLISRCEIMTNFHVVFGPWYVTALKPPSREQQGRFTLTAVTLEDGSHPSATAIPAAWGDYRGPDRQFRRPGEDWAILTLDNCLGQTYGWFIPDDPAYADDITDEGDLTAIGYSSGRQMMDGDCSLLPGGGAVLLHDCTALSGDSGAPVFSRISNKVVAIISGYRSSVSDGGCEQGEACFNTAVPLTLTVIRHIDVAKAALETQRYLLRMGYDAGQFGDIASSKLSAAIALAETSLGYPPTGKPSDWLPQMLRIMVALRQ